MGHLWHCVIYSLLNSKLANLISLSTRSRRNLNAAWGWMSARRWITARTTTAAGPRGWAATLSPLAQVRTPGRDLVPRATTAPTSRSTLRTTGDEGAAWEGRPACAPAREDSDQHRWASAPLCRGRRARRGTGRGRTPTPPQIEHLSQQGRSPSSNILVEAQPFVSVLVTIVITVNTT